MDAHLSLVAAYVHTSCPVLNSHRTIGINFSSSFHTFLGTFKCLKVNSMDLGQCV